MYEKEMYTVVISLAVEKNTTKHRISKHIYVGIQVELSEEKKHILHHLFQVNAHLYAVGYFAENDLLVVMNFNDTNEHIQVC